jgi:Flp pilus assembly protein TadG
MRADEGQTVGIYIVAIAALFFLAFAYLAVGQASVVRNRTQTAADAAALAAARAQRDAVHDAFLAALRSGDIKVLGQLLTNPTGYAPSACSEAATYAADNGATVTGGCTPVYNPPGFLVGVRSVGTVGRSVVKGSETVHATAHATAVVQPRCTVDKPTGPAVNFTCDTGPLVVDPTGTGFILDLSQFYTVHLSN